MTLSQFTDDFIRRYSGKSIGFPGNSYRGECLSLTKKFIKEFYKIDPPPSGCNGARCYWSVFPNPLGTVLKKIPNTPELIPQKGWIAVWNSRTGAGYGHIGTVVDANINTFRSFDQNWGSRNAQIVTHDYKNLYGFLVQKGGDMSDKVYTQAEWQIERDERNKNWNLYQEQLRENELIETRIVSLKNEIKKLNDDINTLSKTPVVKIAREIEVAGYVWQINGVQVDSDGKITANYKK